MTLRWALEQLNPVMRRQAEAQLGPKVITVTTAGKPGPKPGSSKYNNRRVQADGRIFDSKHEYRCYLGLKVRERAGEITDLRCGVKFALFDPGENCRGEHIGTYRSDFSWREGGKLVVADAKSRITKRLRDWPRTKALLRACYGHEVLEMVSRDK